jgi:hypothetical protein
MPSSILPIRLAIRNLLYRKRRENEIFDKEMEIHSRRSLHVIYFYCVLAKRGATGQYSALGAEVAAGFIRFQSRTLRGLLPAGTDGCLRNRAQIRQLAGICAQCYDMRVLRIDRRVASGIRPHEDPRPYGPAA